MVTQKVWCLSDVCLMSEDICPIPSRSHFGPIMPTTLGKTTPPGWTSPDHAKEQTDAARGSTQGAAEY